MLPSMLQAKLSFSRSKASIGKPFPICNVCRVELTDTTAYPAVLRKKSYICRVCMKQRSKEWERNNRAKRHILNTKYKMRHPERIREQLRDNRQKVKAVVIAHYAPSNSCAVCKTNDMRTLTIHHINNGGSQDRKRRGVGDTFYRSVIKDSFPEGYQVLCMNCNFRSRLADLNETRHQLLKTVAGHYSSGATQCSACGEDDLAVLTIDHIGGGGRSHLKSISPGMRRGRKFYQWLIRNQFPQGYQVLCFNCQFVKRTTHQENTGRKTRFLCNTHLSLPSSATPGFATI